MWVMESCDGWRNGFYSRCVLLPFTVACMMYVKISLLINWVAKRHRAVLSSKYETLFLFPAARFLCPHRR